MALAMAWAAYTQHAWEDYYITYRASKNLATGQGLTFTAGERVHSYTSPLGVLLPAAASLLTGNRSDPAALWIFRLMGAAALAGAVLVVRASLRNAGTAGPLAGIIAAGFVVSDAKTLDYTINGMETPFLLLFLSWAGWALLAQPPRAWVHLGLAWAGLMWTRPDAFVYIGGLAIGTLLFRPRAGKWWQCGHTIGDFLRAGALTTLLYLPWLVWAWRYYGTPVPNTITAKGLFAAPISVQGLWHQLSHFPRQLWSDQAILAGTFMPAYSFSTGWPAFLKVVAVGMALVGMFLWVVPKVRWEARVLSWAALIGQFYLHAWVGAPTPWYLPVVAFISLLAVSLVLAPLAQGAQPFRFGSRVVVGGWLLIAIGTALATAWQLRWQQRIIEDGQRTSIGRWLGEQAASKRETVFLEPLGYIGFYSNLKMLDYPGLSAPEVVAARRRAFSHSYPFCWSELIMDLLPDWIVLRPFERDEILRREPQLLPRFYDLAKVFDVQAEVAAISFLPGRGYLENDAYFEVYRLKPEFRGGAVKLVRVNDLIERKCYGDAVADNEFNFTLHAPARAVVPVAANARFLAGDFGIFDGAFANPQQATDGAEFTVVHVNDRGEKNVLLQRALDPLKVAADRGQHSFRVALPPGAAGRLELVIGAGPAGNNGFDWTYWKFLRLEFAPNPPR